MMGNKFQAKIIKIEQESDGYRIFHQNKEKVVYSYKLHYGLLNFTINEQYNINRRGFYTAVYIEDSVIFSEELSLTEKLTYILVKSFCNTQKTAFPSIEYLSKTSGHSHTTLVEAIDGLTKKEYISAARRRKRPDDKRYLNNIYTFDKKGSQYKTYVPLNIVFAKGLNIRAKMLYVFLLAKVKNGYMVVLPKKELKKFLGIKSWKTVSNHIKTLHRLGFIYTFCNGTKGFEREKSICFLIRRICPKEQMITDEDWDVLEVI